MKVKYSMEQINNNKDIQINLLLTLEPKKDKANCCWQPDLTFKHASCIARVTLLIWVQMRNHCHPTDTFSSSWGSCNCEADFGAVQSHGMATTGDAQKHMLKQWEFLNNWNMGNWGDTSRAKKLYSGIIISSVSTGGLILSSTTVIRKLQWNQSNCTTRKKVLIAESGLYYLWIDRQQHLLCCLLYLILLQDLWQSLHLQWEVQQTITSAGSKWYPLAGAAENLMNSCLSAFQKENRYCTF